MFDLLAIIGALVFLGIIMQLRAILAMPLDAIRLRPTAIDPAHSLGADDLIAAATSELSASGFSGPHWFLGNRDDTGVRGLAVYSHPDGTHLFLLPLFFGDNPNRCISYLVSETEDGRTLVSQPGDPYFSLTAGDNEAAQDLPAGTLLESVAAHRDFASRFGPIRPDDTTRREFLAGPWLEARLQRLVATGSARVGTDGVTRFGLAFGLKAFLAFWNRKKFPVNAAPVPVSRLTLIAQNAQRARERSPAGRHQALLFALSVGLFLLLGGYFFGLTFSLVLMGVIGLHELGHFAAMRAFGYRNVHMLALPLVGGVTIGHEEHPNAAHRAWMSLMGPLPGIVLGWILAFVIAFSSPSQLFDLESIPTLAVIVLLVVNYLNVLPFMPLDGGHIVQALLPARWYAWRIGMIVIGALSGIGIGVVFGLYGIALIAALQLLIVPTLIGTRRAILDLDSRNITLTDLAPARQLRLALEALERTQGPTATAGARVAQAEDIVRTMAVKPMGWMMRLVTGGTYLSLMVVPVVAIGIALVGSTLVSGLPNHEPSPEALQLAAARDAESARIVTQVDAMSIGQILNSLSVDAEDPLPGPAREESIVATEKRLGAALPEDVRAFYRLHNGYPGLGIDPVEQLTRMVDLPENPLPDAAYDDHLGIDEFHPEGEGALREIPLTRGNQWVHLGGFQGDDLVLLDVDEPPAIAGHRLINFFFESPIAYRNLDAFLRRQYAERRISDAHDRLYEEQARSVEARLANESMDVLLEYFPPPPWIVQWRHPESAVPPGVDIEALAATERRLGMELPDDLRAAYIARDGHEDLLVSPLRELRRLDPHGGDRPTLESVLARPLYWHQAGAAPVRLRDISFDGKSCVVLSDQSDGDAVAPDLWWCSPTGPKTAGLVSPRSARIYPGFKDYVVHRTAQRILIDAD